MPGISYDDSGSLASYFGITFLLLVLVPTTYNVFKPDRKEHLSPLCVCNQCRSNTQRIQKRKSAQRTRRLAKRAIPLLLGWALTAYLFVGVWRAPGSSGIAIYDPFQILGISGSSSEKQIKKHYKKLSLQFHPDKVVLSENQTAEDIESKFVELTKAYKSLTDETTRENLAKYGNPDGPQQREDKIAIPQWVVEGKNGFWVLGLYGLVLGLGIPWALGRWWFSQQRHTRDGIDNASAESFFHRLRDDTDLSSLITIVASAVELQAIVGVKKAGSKKERKERQGKVEDLEHRLEARKAEIGFEESPTMRKESKVVATTASTRRVRALLWCQLLRIQPIDVEMQTELEAILQAIQPVLTGLVNIALAHNWMATSVLCMKLQPALVQALPVDSSPVAQLPGIDQAEALETEIVKGAEGKRWIEKLVKMDGGVSGDAKAAAKVWPRLEIVSVEFKVPGEKIVTPSAMVQLNYTCRYIYPDTPPTSSDNKASLPNGHLPNGDSHDEKLAVGSAEAALEHAGEPALATAEKTEEKANGDLTEVISEVKEVVKERVGVKMSEANHIGQKGKPKSKSGAKEKVVPNGYAHAPHWPLLRKPHYYAFLGDSKLDKIIVQPTRITDIPLPRSDGLPSEPREFSLQFQAPPQANLYSFVAHWRSDTFLGADVEVPVMLKVEEPTDGGNDDEDDISDPEEDSLAGQMAMMRGGNVKASGVHGKRSEHDDSESQEGSEYEYEYESSSDEDGPKKPAGSSAGKGKSSSSSGSTEKGRKGKAINEDTDSDSD